MPTPVSAARQCLAPEAASVLDDAVAVARRRGHAQTTSLHMVSSLLSLPRSPLREACGRARSGAYPSRVQFKALEFSLGVSLDRLPSTARGGDEQPPPVSNSLMAAIKRSQANQRRQPENYTFYQQQYASCSSNSPSSVPVVKVELQNLVLSILDDPLVSRVFGEAGFRSYDIKLATMRPGSSFRAHHLLGYSSRYSKRPIPPMFLCNLAGSEQGRGFTFPFMGNLPGEDNSFRLISEVMVRDCKRNPLLLGASAEDSLKNFLETVQHKEKGSLLPEGLNGVNVVSVNDQIVKFLSGDCDEGAMELKLGELTGNLESGKGSGVVLNLGDFSPLAGDGVDTDRLGYLVGKLAELVRVYRGKLWLIGAAATHEVHSRILDMFPGIEDDWDLGVLPVTSMKVSAGRPLPRSSLMGSFVPLGGFFSMPSEVQSPLSSAFQSRCHLCDEKCQQEVASLTHGGHCVSVAEKCKSSLPLWLQAAEPNAQTDLTSVKGKDNTVLLNAKVIGIQKKWDNICQQQHLNQAFSKGFGHQLGYQFPRVMGFQVGGGWKENTMNCSNESSNEPGNKNALLSLSTGLALQRGLSSLDTMSKAMDPSMSSKSGENPSESKGGPNSHHSNSLSANIDDGSASPTPVTSVTTNMGLGIVSASTSRKLEKPVDRSCLDLTQGISGTILPNDATLTSCISNGWPQSSASFTNVKDLKLLYRALAERVGRQEEVINVVLQAITQSPVSRKSVWINFQGPDRLGKRKLGIALAEALYGSTESLIYVDLSFQDEATWADAVFSYQVTHKYDLTMRGTVVDYLVEKLSKKPSIVFLDNLEKADMVVQNCLSQAVKTDRFMDLRGREITISNCIFLVTTGSIEGSQQIYNEEDVLRTKGSPIELSIRFDLNDTPTSGNTLQLDNMRKCYPDLLSMNKRKLLYQTRSAEQLSSVEETKKAHRKSNSLLDLNLPAEASETCYNFSGESDSDSSPDTSRSWLEDLNNQIDQTAVFKPFDFDTLAKKLFQDMTKCLLAIAGSNCSMEIEPKAMQQLLAAGYTFGYERVQDWIQHVVKQGFVAATERFSLSAGSIVKLSTCEGTSTDGLLPSTLIMK